MKVSVTAQAKDVNFYNISSKTYSLEHSKCVPSEYSHF